MRLSGRLRRLSAKVGRGNRLADVGTDHGYVPIALLLEGRIPSAIAMDVNPGPLEHARQHIREKGLSTYIEARLSDGLSGLAAGEADTVLIAGMGGALTVRILSGGGHCLPSVQELVLQPQSEIHLVRRWLCGNGFRITEEDILLEDGKYYPMMKAVHREPELMDEAELYYGKAALQQSPTVLLEYLDRELEKTERILVRLLGSVRKDPAEELMEKKGRLLCMLDKLKRCQAYRAETVKDRKDNDR